MFVCSNLLPLKYRMLFFWFYQKMNYYLLALLSDKPSQFHFICCMSCIRCSVNPSCTKSCALSSPVSWLLPISWLWWKMPRSCYGCLKSCKNSTGQNPRRSRIAHESRNRGNWHRKMGKRPRIALQTFVGWCSLVMTPRNLRNIIKTVGDKKVVDERSAHSPLMEHAVRRVQLLSAISNSNLREVVLNWQLS